MRRFGTLATMSTAGSNPHTRAAQRRGQINTLRTRVAALAVGIFLAAGAGLFAQLASGHDPGLTDRSSASTAQQSTATSTAGSDGGSSGSGNAATDDGWGDDWDDGGASSQSAAPADTSGLTTRQS